MPIQIIPAAGGSDPRQQQALAAALIGRAIGQFGEQQQGMNDRAAIVEALKNRFGPKPGAIGAGTAFAGSPELGGQTNLGTPGIDESTAMAVALNPQLASILLPQQRDPIKLGAGDILLDPTTRQPIFTAPKAPSSAEERVLAAGLAPGTPEAREFLLGRPPVAPQQIFNAPGPGPQIATINGIPYAVMPDPSAPGGVRVTPIAGTPEALEREQAATAQQQQQEQRVTAANIVTEDIDRALELTEGFTTGAFGQVLSNIGGTDARDLQQLLQTVKANVSFERLQQMRKASPTGGALGSISDSDRVALESVLGSLDQSQSQAQLQYNLKRLSNVVNDIVHGVGKGPVRYDLTRSPIASTATAPQVGAIEDGYRFLGGDPSDPASWEKVQ